LKSRWRAACLHYRYRVIVDAGLGAYRLSLSPAGRSVGLIADLLSLLRVAQLSLGVIVIVVGCFTHARDVRRSYARCHVE